MANYLKDPEAVLDYKFDWSDWLETSPTETISVMSVTVTSGLTLDSSAVTDTNTSVTAWLSGGTAGTIYTVTCQITTSAGRTDERSILIDCKER